jgi:2-phosphosulfolactate phosphatase
MKLENIDVFTSAHSFHEEDVRDKTVIMIDVLRASSTIVTALQNKARGVIPVSNKNAALRLTENMEEGNYLLSGEEDGVKIDGYDLTNSPIAHSVDVVKDKVVVLNTTNGTKALNRTRLASSVLVGSFLNLEAVVNYLKQMEGKAVLVCAGWRGRLTLEDLLCAGNIISELGSGHIPPKVRDGVKVAFGLYEKFGEDIEQVIRSSNYAERLKNTVSLDDIIFCCQRSILQVLPVMKEGIIRDSNGKEQ